MLKVESSSHDINGNTLERSLEPELSVHMKMEVSRALDVKEKSSPTLVIPEPRRLSPAQGITASDRHDVITDKEPSSGSPGVAHDSRAFQPFPWQGSFYPGFPPHFPYFPYRLPGYPFAALPEHFSFRVMPEHLNGYHLPHGSVLTSLPFQSSLTPYHFPIGHDKAYGLNIRKGEDGENGAVKSAFDMVKPPKSPHLSPKSTSPVSDRQVEKKKTKDAEQAKYQCSGCQKNYSTFSGLSKHKQFHCAQDMKKEFTCKYCDKTYVSLGALKMHIRTHTLPCKCKICGKAFSRPWLLQGHIRTHTGEKPFSCVHCLRAFADRSNLRAHLQTHSDVKKYSCKTCSKTFSRMSLLLKHEDTCCVIDA